MNCPVPVATTVGVRKPRVGDGADSLQFSRRGAVSECTLHMQTSGALAPILCVSGIFPEGQAVCMHVG